MTERLITVAVPACNGARHLPLALESILRSPVPFDVIVVDDRSDDDTVAIARALVGDRGRVVVNPERLGLAGNWNRCVELSETPAVAIFHQDDVMLPGHLGTHIKAHRTNPRFGWVASGAEVIDDAGQPVPESVVERGGLGEQDRDFELDVDPKGLAWRGSVPDLAARNPLRCSAVTINRQAHAEVGGFDPSYRYVVDWDFWARVAAARPVAWRAGVTVAIRWHPASETHRFAQGMLDLEESARLLDRIASVWDQGRENPRWPRGAGRRLARAYLNRAYVGFKAGNLALTRRALARSIRLAPTSSLLALVRDPRLMAQMTATILVPGLVRRANPGGVPSEWLPDRLESGDNG